MKYYLLFPLFLVSLAMSGQQDAQFTQFMFNKQYYNPAYSGSRGVPTIGVIYRKQWLGFDGAPEVQQVSFNTPVLGKRVGLGLLLNRQTIGITQTVEGTLSYSYSLVKTKSLTVKFGLQGSYGQFAIRFSDKGNIIRDPGDPSTRSEDAQKSSGNVGAGLYIGHTNFYFGISVPKLLENTIGVNDVGTLTATKSRHLYTMAGAALPIGSKVRLLPSGLLKQTEKAPISVDANLGIELARVLTIGASYRTGGSGGDDSIDFLLHFLIKNRLGIGVAFDNPLSKIKNFSKGSVEVLLQYNFKDVDDNGTSNKNRDMSNPRFFF